MNLSTRIRNAGFSLIEVTLALGVAGFCLLAIFGLLPVGVNSNKIAVEQSDAANIAVGVIADLQAAPKSDTKPMLSPRYKFSIPPATGSKSTDPQVLYIDRDGNALGTVVAPVTTGGVVPYFRVSAGFAPPTTTTPVGGPKGATQVRLFISWPTRVEPSPKWPTAFAGSFETTIALNRN